MRTPNEFADNVAREHLLNAVGLRLVHKHRHGDGAHARRDARGVSGGVVAAARNRQGQDGDREQHGARKPHWTFPCGRTAARAVAQSAAVRAARRRLSTAAQSQKPFTWTTSRRTATMISSLPATFTLLGESSGARAICTCSPARQRAKSPAAMLLSSSM